MPPTNPLTGLGGQSRKPPAIDDALALLPLLTGGAPSPIPTTGGFLFGPEERALQHKIQTDAAAYNQNQASALIGLAAMAEEGRRRREQAAAARGFAATLPGANAAQTDYLASDPAALRTRSEQLGASVAPPSPYQAAQLGLGERRTAATERQAAIAARSAASLDRRRSLLNELAVLKASRETETDALTRKRLDLQSKKLERELSRMGAVGNIPVPNSEFGAMVEALAMELPEDRRAKFLRNLYQQRLEHPSVATIPSGPGGETTTVTYAPLSVESARAAASGGAAQPGAVPTLPESTVVGGSPGNLSDRTLLAEVGTITKQLDDAKNAIFDKRGGVNRTALAAMHANLPLSEGRLSRQSITRALSILIYLKTGKVQNQNEAQRTFETLFPSILDSEESIRAKFDTILTDFNAALKDAKYSPSGEAAAQDISPETAEKITQKAKALIEQGMSPDAAFEAARAGTSR